MRNFASWRIWLMLGIVAIISGCKQPVEIVSPAKDSVSNTAPEFRIRFNNGGSGQLHGKHQWQRRRTDELHHRWQRGGTQDHRRHAEGR